MLLDLKHEVPIRLEKACIVLSMGARILQSKEMVVKY